MPTVTITLTDTPDGGLAIESLPTAAVLGSRYDANAASPAQQVALMAMAHMAQHSKPMHAKSSPIILLP